MRPIITLICFVGTLLCVAEFAFYRRWYLAITFACLAIYILLERLIHFASLPPWFANTFIVAFALLLILRFLHNCMR